MKADRTVVTFAILLIASLSLLAACSSDTGANADGGGGHAGASAGSGGGSGVDGAVADTGTSACAGLHCGDLCNSCPPSAPHCPGAIAYCDTNGTCVIGSAPVCP